MIEHTLQVLLVEDNPGDQRLVTEALRTDPGLRLTRASTLAETLEHLEQAAPVPDLIVLDLGLPDSQGLDTYRRVAQASPGTSVIVLSGDEDDGRALTAVAEGAQDFLVKGHADLQSLPRAIRYAVERATLVQQLETNLRHRTGLLEIGQVALEVTDPDELARATVAIVREALDVDEAIVLEAAPGASLRVRGWTRGPVPDGTIPAAPGGVVGTALRQQAALRVRDLRTDPRFDDPFLIQQGIVGVTVVPLRDATGAFGVLGVCTHTPRNFTAQDAEFLVGAARALSSAQRRRVAELSLHERVKELSGLVAVKHALQDDTLTAAQIGQLVTGQLHAAMQDLPDLRTEVTLDGTTWAQGVERRAGRQDPAISLACDIQVAGSRRGEVRALHVDGRPFLLPHEQDLVEALADTVGTRLSRRESDARLKALMEQLPGVVWTVDRDLVVTSHTGKVHEDIGLEPHSLVGTPGVAYMGSDSPGLAAAARAVEGESSVVEEQFLDRWWQVHVEPLRTADGDIVGAIGLGLDVTAAKEAQRDADLSRHRLQGLFDNALDAFILADDDGRYLDANPAAEQLTGRTREQLIGLRARDLAPGGSEQEADAAWAAFLAAGAAEGEFEVLRPDGTRILAEFRAVVGIVPGVHLSVMRDVTDRRRAEEALRDALAREQEAADRLRQLDHMKNAFLTGVSHEMRTPLTTIVGLSEAVTAHAARLEEPARVSLVERIAANARRLHRLLTDLLDVDRLAQGVVDARRTETELGDLVRRVLEDVALNRHTLTVTGDELTVAADVPRLERIVEHLVHNAVRHTPAGSSIDVSWTRADHGVVLQVDDDGPGVADELKQTIFEPFQHGDSDAAKVGGTGIGLAMVQRFAQVHGGRAWVEDRPGGGASFRVFVADLASNQDASDSAPNGGADPGVPVNGREELTRAR